MTNILISGILGHMGKNVYELAQADKDVCCVCGIDLTKTACDGTPVYDSFADVHEPVDVVIDFSSAANLKNVLGYAQNADLSCGFYSGAHLAYRKLNFWKFPTRTVAMTDGAKKMVSGQTFVQGTIVRYWDVANAWTFTGRHLKFCNTLYLDGHVGKITWQWAARPDLSPHLIWQPSMQ